ncbi:acyl-CoA dehydrogenase family protein [Pseudonocardia sp. KRD291]|uniref:acyl-CoA dehydrogenase family protein n=1 Tax=Pseudonocardia sp. KRD291 TaxID=2792007 RepID=UPI001C4A6683|nr:acyl-CoA dehydrogenase family protein [Pseudonocardia sp. KRD291]MBW0101226.1 hypothetical protein [Pseudonocardia sp. KRD291]
MSTAPHRGSLDGSDEDSLLRSTAGAIAERCRSGSSEAGDHLRCRAALADAGLLELRSRDEDGAPLATATQAGIVVEELARSTCGAGLAGTTIAAELLAATGAPDTGDAATVALRADLESWAEPGDAVVWDAAGAARALAVVDGSVVAYATGSEIAQADISRTLLATGSSRTLTAVEAATASRVITFAHLVLTADLLGTASGILDDAVAYAGTRVQFGKPIGTFQAVQHLCARAFVQVEAMRSSLVYASWLFDADHDRREAEEAALVAKAYASEVAVEVIEAAVQVFGGIAITWEFPAHLHLRRALLTARVLGGPAVLQRRVLSRSEG